MKIQTYLFLVLEEYCILYPIANRKIKRPNTNLSQSLVSNISELPGITLINYCFIYTIFHYLFLSYKSFLLIQ
jgi:hypothetical protein